MRAELSVLEGRARTAEAAAEDSERKNGGGDNHGIRTSDKLAAVEKERNALQRELASARTHVSYSLLLPKCCSWCLLCHA